LSKPVLQFVSVPEQYAGHIEPVLGEKCRLLHPTIWEAANSWREDLPADSVVILTMAEDSAQEMVRRSQIITLREEMLCWNPVILLCDAVTEACDELERWALRRLPLHPFYDELFSAIETASVLNSARRTAVTQSALACFSADLRYIRRALTSIERFDLTRLHSDLRQVRDGIAQSEIASALPVLRDLKTAIEMGLELPSLAREDIERLKQVTLSGERAAIEAHLGTLPGWLHTLNNRLRANLVAMQAPYGHAYRANHFLRYSDETVVKAVDRNLIEIMAQLNDVLKQPLHEFASQPSESIKATLRHALASVEDELLSLNFLIQMNRPEGVRIQARHVLVVEDDSFWCQEIHAVLEDLGVRHTVVATISEAEAWLEQNKSPTLVITDMGVPLDEAAAIQRDIDLEAGLKLVEKYGQDRRYRFMVLTAHEDNPALVFRVFDQGLAAVDYVQKDPNTWEAQLRMRVKHATQRRNGEDLCLQVLAFTGSLVRYGSIEVELNPPAFAVVEYLAAHSPGWCPIGATLSDLSDSSTRAILPKGYDVLTKDRLEDYIYTARQQLRRAFERAGKAAEFVDPIEYDKNLRAYRLITKAKIFKDYASVPRRSVQRTVLVIEDMPRMRAEIVQELAMLGFQVRAVQTTEAARIAIESDPPELISLDLQVPANEAELTAGSADERNTIELMQWIALNHPEIRVAILTAIAGKDRLMLDLMHRYDIYPDDYLSKELPGAVTQLGHRLWRLSRELEYGTRIIEHEDGDPLHHIIFDKKNDRLFFIDSLKQPIELTKDQAVIMHRLGQNPMLPVDREDLIELLWPEEGKMPRNPYNALSKAIGRCADDITTKSHGIINGKKLFGSSGTAYWMRAIVD
jgi:CheY-like chemotaxis protein